MSKKLPIYFSDDAWSSLQELMGPEGKPSPTINTVLEQIAVQNELVEKLGLTGVLGILPPYIAKPSEAPVCRGL